MNNSYLSLANGQTKFADAASFNIKRVDLLLSRIMRMFCVPLYQSCFV